MRHQHVNQERVFTDLEFARRYTREQKKVLKWMSPPIIKGLTDNGFKGGRILDDGCGPGYHAVALKQAFPESEIIGIDLSEPLLEIARNHSSRSGVSEGVRFQSADVQNIPFEDHSFDAVINIFMLHLVDDPVKMCNEVERVLKPDGQMVMIDLRRSRLLSMFEREMRSSYTLPEALDIVRRSNLRQVESRQTLIWWGVMA